MKLNYFHIVLKKVLKKTFSWKYLFINYLLRNILFVIGKRYASLPLTSINKGFRPNLLFEQKELMVYGPKELNGDQKSINRNFPALNYYEVQKSIININSPILVSNKKAFFQPYSLEGCNLEIIDFSHGHVLAQNERNLLINISARTNIEKGIFLGGSWSTNWYHWVIEILSRVELIDKLPKSLGDYPLIVPKRCMASKNHLDFFKLLFRDRAYVEVNSSVRVGQLIFVESPALLVPKLNVENESMINQLYLGAIRIDILKMYRNRLMTVLNKKNQSKLGKSSFKNIFLARKQNKRLYNQSDVIRVLKKYNFEAVFFEELSVEEQLFLIHNADFIVGPTGAAWANMLFSNATKAIIWMPNFLRGVQTYVSLAVAADINMTHIRYETIAKNWYHYMNSDEEYKINLKVLENLIQKKLNDPSN